MYEGRFHIENELGEALRVMKNMCDRLGIEDEEVEKTLFESEADLGNDGKRLQ